MQEVLKDKPVQEFEQPPGVVRAAYGGSYMVFKKGEVGPGTRAEVSEDPEGEGDEGIGRSQGADESELGKILREMRGLKVYDR